MKNSFPSVPLVPYSIYCGNLTENTDNQKITINTINQYSYCIAEKDPEFKNALLTSDILLPDGIAILAAVKLLTGKKIKKIAGADIHQSLLKKLNKEGGKCFYLGSAENTLLKIKERIAIEFPSINVESYSPPFKSSFTEMENNTILDRINLFKPDVLFVGMTAPKQEKWSNLHKEKIDVNIICTIGAVFDFYAGTIKRPNKFIISLGLEWFARLIKEPKRMWKRYIIYGPIFISNILRQKFTLK